MKKFIKIETKKQIYILLFIISVIFSLILTVLYYVNNHPLDLVITSKTKLLTNHNKRFYKDLNGNGKTESVILGIDKDSVNYYIAINDDNNRIFRQFNFTSPIGTGNIFFDNFNDDNYKDLFVIYKQSDSLFLSVIDIKTDNYFINKHLLLTKPDSVKTKFWDINIIFGGMLNRKDFIFAVSGAFSHYPRTVYSFDIFSKKITHTFPTNASIMKISMFDLNNDNEKEIIITSVATGNIRPPAIYNDQTNWLFVLNQKLHPVFAPLNFGTYPSSGFFVEPYLYNGKYYFSVATEIAENGKRINKLFTVGSDGKIVREQQVPGSIINQIIFYDNNKNPQIIVSTSGGNVFVFNHSLKLISKHKTGIERLELMKTISPSVINEKLILAKNNNDLFLFSYNFTKNAELDLNSIPQPDAYNFSFKNCASDKHESLFVFTKENLLNIAIKQNRYFKYLPLLFLFLTLFIFIVLFILHKVFSLLSTYTKFFTHQLQHSPNGIIILDSDGKLQYNNKKIGEMLKVKTELKKGRLYDKIFPQFHDISKTISSSIKSKEKLREKISYSLADYIFKGEIIVTPFTSKIGFTYAYLIQIVDHTESVTSDRLKTWSATIQRIAHEIKTPLSGINLGLDTLKNRLNRETNNYSKDISLIQNEVNRIKALTKNFLIFSNMEKPNFAELNLSFLINESLGVFQNYFNSGIELTLGNTNFTILGDFTQLKQLFHIVIENAIDACGGKGKIKIKVKRLKIKGERKSTESENIKVKSTKEDDIKTTNNFIKISITDSGKGIPEEELTKIFEPYYTTKKDGTGIGLAIAKKIIEDHKGRLEIESKFGAGTKVSIYLETF